VAKYTLWDVPSGTLLIDTDDESSARSILQTLLATNGVIILDELVLGIEQPDPAAHPDSVTGEDIVRAMHLSIPEASRFA
jgi:hypothetical protein